MGSIRVARFGKRGQKAQARAGKGPALHLAPTISVISVQDLPETTAADWQGRY